jgi:hypothetical protein
MDVVRSICFCHARIDAMMTNEFRWSHELKGWYFLDAPRRSPKYPASADTKGFPYTYVSCPWCGHDLPGVIGADAQADGQEGFR